MMTTNWMTRLGMTRMSPPPLAQPLCTTCMWGLLMPQQQRLQLLLTLNRSLQLPPRLPHQQQLQHRMLGQTVIRQLQAAQGLCLKQAGLQARQRPHDQQQLRRQGEPLAVIAEKLGEVLYPYVPARAAQAMFTSLQHTAIPQPLLEDLVAADY